MTQTKNYKVINGVSYNENTPNKVVQWLETSNLSKQKIRVFYGDAETGIDWMEEYDTMGTVGRSMGSTKSPLLIKNSRSIGGILLELTLRIVQVKLSMYISMLITTFLNLQCIKT